DLMNASSAGTRSQCPKCRADVEIRGTEPSATIAARPRLDDSAGVATRRIDSRSLGLAGLSQPQTPPGGMDLEAFIKSRDADHAAQPPPQDTGVAAALMKPPVAEMEKIAVGIREAARGFDASAPLPARSTPAPAHDQVAEHRGEDGDREQRPNVVRPQRTAESALPVRPYPASRGLILGAVAGILVGAGSMALTMLDPGLVGQLVTPLPQGIGALGLPEPALRILLPALLGSLSGFIAAAAGSPSRDQRALRLGRAAGFALLAGLACGLTTSLLTGEGLKVWPIANWMRDLLLVGLVTTALDRIIPQPRH
ncbi:MAG TPA: hypothetical protein VFE84_12095, partial [Patescibacteria group bacterium]|nr:hypothetical protein [Patescibacteria group bacterium]